MLVFHDTILFLLVNFQIYGGSIMRKDIYERMKIMKQEGVKPNYAEIARRWNCDYRTVKRYFEEDVVPRRKILKPSKLDPYKTIIEEKVGLGCTASSIYHFIRKKGYDGKYTIVGDYIRAISLLRKA